MPRADNRENILGYNSPNNQYDSGLVTANPRGSIVERQELGYQHIHKSAQVYPTLAAGVTITAGGQAWTLGAFAELIPAGAIPKSYDVHWVNVETASSNAVYELVLYSGAIGQEAEVARVRTRQATTASGPANVPIQIPIQHADARISAKLASSTGGSNISVSVFYHDYN